MSYCLETEGSVLELTSSAFSFSGMLILVLAVKALVGKVVKGGLVQVWVEMREARDARVRLVENIFELSKGYLDRLMYLSCPFAANNRR